jgi:hypothetical protein
MFETGYFRFANVRLQTLLEIVNEASANGAGIRQLLN